VPLRANWIDGDREPQCAPNPAYPLGIDIDTSGGAERACRTSLKYPADRCGAWIVQCTDCGASIACTTAGSPDDPRSIKIACKGRPV
jgi:hypothetical protein